MSREPRTYRERVAYALAARNILGVGNVQLLDEELDELQSLLAKLNPLGEGRAFGHSPDAAYLRALLARERRARGLTHEVVFYNWSGGVEEMLSRVWREFLPDADAALSVLMEVPEIARLLGGSPAVAAAVYAGGDD